MNALFFISLSVLSVAGAAAVLLGHGGRVLGFAWLLCCFALGSLTLFHPGPPWVPAGLLFCIGIGVAYHLPPLSPPEPPAFACGSLRRLLAIAAIWAVSLMILRASHHSPHWIVEAGASAAAPHLYWSLYTTAALFGLGLLTLVLKRGAAQAWCGVGLLFLSPVPAALAAGARLGTAEATTLADISLAACALHAVLAMYALKHVRRVSGQLDTAVWEELQG